MVERTHTQAKKTNSGTADFFPDRKTAKCPGESGE
jgi:hypothetical protein